MKKKGNPADESSQSGRSEAVPLSPVIRERIAQRAYELYQMRGSMHGLDVEDWLEAERRVLTETRAGSRAQAKAEAKPKATAASESKAKTPVRESPVSTKPGSISGRP
jgi:pyruvate/2-oxoglutarate dehydrogenase complex dihydrolipoamide acyltransferase (E2) component